MKQQIITLHVKHQETRMERRERQRREMRGRFFAAVLAILAAGALFWALAATEPVIVVETAAADKTGTPVSILETEEPEARTPARISRYAPITDEERDMIAGIVYLEARGEPAEGQQAVAEVILNRVASGAFPDTVEEVVMQDKPLQFTTSPLLDTAEPGEDQYNAVDNALYGEPVLPETVVFFDTKPMNDNVWGTIGNHIFCGPYGGDDYA